MKLYMHKTTIEHRAYGELLETRKGLSWSTTGEQCDRIGFEEGDFDKLVASKWEGIPESWRDPNSDKQLLIGQPFRIVSDCDPHGLS